MSVSHMPSLPYVVIQRTISVLQWCVYLHLNIHEPGSPIHGILHKFRLIFDIDSCVHSRHVRGKPPMYRSLRELWKIKCRVGKG